MSCIIVCLETKDKPKAHFKFAPHRYEPAVSVDSFKPETGLEARRLMNKLSLMGLIVK